MCLFSSANCCSCSPRCTHICMLIFAEAAQQLFLNLECDSKSMLPVEPCCLVTMVISVKYSIVVALWTLTGGPSGHRSGTKVSKRFWSLAETQTQCLWPRALWVNSASSGFTGFKSDTDESGSSSLALSSGSIWHFTLHPDLLPSPHPQHPQEQPPLSECFRRAAVN